MKSTLLVCCGTNCIANGSRALVAALEAAVQETRAELTIECTVKCTGCAGLCAAGPIVTVLPENTTYYKVKAADAPELVRCLAQGGVLERRLYKNEAGELVRSLEEHPFFRRQKKWALRNVGVIDPESLDDYLERGGYESLRKALAMTPEEIIREVEISGLRGRGGAGFPTGRKWRSAASYESTPRYVVCNGDEGDPGAFMDWSIMEGDPHSVLEGMAICALAIGAEEGFLYVRNEYTQALARLRHAIAAAEAHGFLGGSICGTNHKLKLSVVQGGGAFVCGESTALMASIEGRVGEPRAKYIRSVQRGLWDQPTVLNNVESLANIPLILQMGGAAYAKVGTERSSGTKAFSLVGKVKRTGLVEVPMGVTLRELIYDVAGGVKNDRPFKAVQTGGPSGGCIPAELLDLPVDFDTLTEHGAMMGSGGMIVMDDRDCMVEVARYYVDFLSEESCGKCTPCREGLRHMLAILTDICAGRGQEGDLELLEQLGQMLMDASLCALGKSAPNPVLTTLRFFRAEYEAHIREKRCPAGACPELTTFRIDPVTCKSCGACLKACPAGVIKGAKKEPYIIDPAGCIGCGSCREACRYDAVNSERRSV